MEKEFIENLYKRINLKFTCNDEIVVTKTINGLIELNQLEDYQKKEYILEAKIDGDEYIELYVKINNKWIICKSNKFVFDIDKPIQGIRIAFTANIIKPLEWKLKVIYADKKAWDEKLEYARIKRLTIEFNPSAFTNINFAWILTKKPKWLARYHVSLKCGDYDFIEKYSNKNENMLLINLPEATYTGVITAYDSDDSIIVDVPIHFTIKLNHTNHIQPVYNGRHVVNG